MSVRALVVLAVIGSGQGCGPEYEVKPVENGPDRFVETCDPDADANALPEDRPVAVLNVAPEVVLPIHEGAMFNGSGSYDPNDLDLTEYHWRLVERPPGSAIELPDYSVLGPTLRSFVPDVVGEYVVELTVVNEDCVSSEPAYATLVGRPTQSLWIEMFWQYPGDDMDLHLVTGGSPYTTEGDCFYGNCVGGGPDWGEPGEWYDDPFLDLDDIPGTGPENINVADPAEGRYTVTVHDYPGSVYTGPNQVTVRIYVDAELAWQGTKTITGEDQYVPFADVQWPSGAITAR